MAIPTFQEAMIPVLRHAAQGGQYRRADFTAAVSDHFNLSPAERSELLSSGKQTVVRNRTDWAVQYLHRAKLLNRVNRGVY
ncbi:MAG: winged helix-turn-helix domain-containing protein, partial [Phycisphaerales bacterium JB065]